MSSNLITDAYKPDYLSKVSKFIDIIRRTRDDETIVRSEYGLSFVYGPYKLLSIERGLTLLKSWQRLRVIKDRFREVYGDLYYTSLVTLVNPSGDTFESENITEIITVPVNNIGYGSRPPAIETTINDWDAS